MKRRSRVFTIAGVFGVGPQPKGSLPLRSPAWDLALGDWPGPEPHLHLPRSPSPGSGQTFPQPPKPSRSRPLTLTLSPLTLTYHLTLTGVRAVSPTLHLPPPTPFSPSGIPPTDARPHLRSPCPGALQPGAPPPQLPPPLSPHL